MKFAAYLLNLSATFIFIYSCICLCTTTTTNGTSINFQYCKMVNIKNIRADAINLTISARGSVAIIFALTAKRFFDIKKKEIQQLIGCVGCVGGRGSCSCSISIHFHYKCQQREKRNLKELNGEEQGAVGRGWAGEWGHG